MSERRAVITGLGAVTPLGNTVSEFWENLKEGVSGVEPIPYFNTENHTAKIAATVKKFQSNLYFEPKEAKRIDMFIQYGMAASLQAFEDSGLNENNSEPERSGVIIGSGVGGLATLERDIETMLTRGPKRISPFLIPYMITDMASGMVSMRLNFKGPNYCCVSACASAGHAVYDSLNLIRSNKADIVLTGGTEAAITRVGIGGFASMKALSTRETDPQKASCPFDSKRDGFVMGEGAGIFVLEELEHAKKRGANIYAEVMGAGITGDANHITQPDPGGLGAARAMTLALEDSKMEKEEIDYINAHGTSTPLNDKFETLAVKAAFKDHATKLNISSTKSMHGHALGASGGIEGVATVLAMQNGVIPPTINLEDPDPDCDLNYTPNTAEEKPLTATMSNSLGFGGHNVSLIFRKFDS